jgi:hypothetical protein
MTQYKHIIVLVLLLLTLGFSAKAQGTPRFPNVGTTQTYTVNGIAGGVSYEFYITASIGGVRLDDSATGEFDFIGSPSGTFGVGDNAASAQIAWNIGASEHIYYVCLQVTGSTGCSNSINLEVSPQPGFDLLSENVPVGNTTSCPAISESDGFNPLATAYNAGSSKLLFKVKREFGTDNTGTPATGDTYDWSFIPVLEVDPTILGLSNIIISIEGTNSGVITADAGNRYTVNGFDDEVIVTVSIDNAPGTIRDVTMQVTLGVESTTNLSDSNPSNNNVTHTIHVMPLIGGMGGV